MTTEVRTNLLKMLTVVAYALIVLLQLAVDSVLVVQLLAALNSPRRGGALIIAIVVVPLVVPLVFTLSRIVRTRSLLPTILFERAPLIALSVLVGMTLSFAIIALGLSREAPFSGETLLGDFLAAFGIAWLAMVAVETTLFVLNRPGNR